MGEAIKAVANTLGLSAYIMGILVNLNNVIGILMGMAGFVWGIYKALQMRENWLIRQLERRKMYDDYNKNKKNKASV